MWRDADSRPLRRAALLAAVLWCAMAGLAVAQSAHEIAPAGADAERQVERYHITIGPGGALWDVGFNRLPMLALEQGEQRVMEIVEGAFRRQYAARGSGEVRAGTRSRSRCQPVRS